MDINNISRTTKFVTPTTVDAIVNNNFLKLTQVLANLNNLNSLSVLNAYIAAKLLLDLATPELSKIHSTTDTNTMTLSKTFKGSLIYDRSYANILKSISSKNITVNT